MGQTTNQKAYSHFMHNPSGLRDRDGSSQAHEHKYGIHRIGNSVYGAGTKRIRGVCDDLKVPITQTSHSEGIIR